MLDIHWWHSDGDRYQSDRSIMEAAAVCGIEDGNGQCVSSNSTRRIQIAQLILPLFILFISVMTLVLSLRPTRLFAQILSVLLIASILPTLLMPRQSVVIGGNILHSNNYNNN